jgi:hypothetical protein
MRIMIDSNVHDLIADDQVVLEAIRRRIESGQLKLVSTHIQRDELALAAEPKRTSLLEIYGLAENVATTGALLDVSRWNECTWGTDEVNASIVAIMAGNPKHAEDTLIAATAADTADLSSQTKPDLPQKFGALDFLVLCGRGTSSSHG